MKCWKCGGKGSIMVESDNGIGWIPKICPVCHGKMEEKFSNQDILCLVNVQNGFLNEFTKPTILELRKFLSDYEFSKVLVVKFINQPNTLFVNELGYEKMMTPEACETIIDIKPFVSVTYLKGTFGFLNQGFLEQIKILNNGELPKHVLLAGIDLETHILAIAINLFDIGIKPILLADFTTSFEGKEIYHHGLRSFELFFGRGSILRLG